MPSGRNTTVGTELKKIVDAMSAIQAALSRLAPMVAGGNSANGAVPLPRPVRKLRLTPKRQAALKLQGQYLGALRSLTPAQKKKVKAVAQEKGVVPATKLARQLSGKR
jgi:hypothetical protein